MSTQNHNKSLIVIVGPTAVGKTDVSVNLAQRLKSSIINADSRQLYTEMRIGTAKPSESEMKGVRHYFVDDRSLNDDFSAGKFELEAIKILSKEFETRNVCIMSGGSGLYIDAVCYGLDSFPKVDQEIRNELNRRLKEEGVDSLYSE